MRTNAHKNTSVYSILTLLLMAETDGGGDATVTGGVFGLEEAVGETAGVTVGVTAGDMVGNMVGVTAGGALAAFRAGDGCDAEGAAATGECSA